MQMYYFRLIVFLSAFYNIFIEVLFNIIAEHLTGVNAESKFMLEKNIKTMLMSLARY